MFVPDSDVRYICLARSHQLKAISHALEGTDYNTAITREVIYTIGQSGFTQLYNNAKLVAELLGIEDGVSFPKCRVPRSLAVLLFNLNDNLIINDGYRRNRKDFIRIMLKEQEFEIKFKDLAGRIARVLGIKWKTFSTTKRYAFSFYEIIKWYSRWCNLFEFNLLQYKRQEVFANTLHQSTKYLNFMIGYIRLVFCFVWQTGDWLPEN